MTAWTATELDIVRARYASEHTAVIAADMNRTLRQVYQKANSLGLRKSAEYLSSPSAKRLHPGDMRGVPMRFVPGMTPWNKGKPHPPTGRASEAHFKPGNVPPNLQPVGHIRTNSDGYQDIKVGHGMRQWVLLHRWNWKQAHGEFPPSGMSLVFRDGNRMNCDISNLECLTRAELMKRNSVHNLPKELALVCQLRGALNRQINKGKS